MVFIAGPRQVGKTFLAKNLDPESIQYFNYDFVKDQVAIHKMQWDPDRKLIVLDELHKMNRWKSWVKGLWDTQKEKFRFVVTGSAKLDFVRKSGDSLAGRYFLHRLHPLSVKELLPKHSPEESLKKLLTFSGFPEPFFSNNAVEANRWRRGYIDRVVRDDLIDLEEVSNVKAMQYLVELLSKRVGSAISYKSLSEDLSVSPKTVKKWIEILENLYVVFIVSPYSKKINRAIRKEPKVYFYDIGKVENEGARLENLVAYHLLKRNHFLEDCLGEEVGLHYIKDKEKREVDFVTTKKEKIEYLIEVKSSKEDLSSSLKYFQERHAPLAAVQLVQNLDRQKMVGSCEIKNLAHWLSKLEA